MFWTVEKIHDLPNFGRKMGWFYGIVKDDGKFYWTEIYPGMGFAQTTKKFHRFIPTDFVWDEDYGRIKSVKSYFISWGMAIRDIFRYRPNKVLK